MQTETLTAGNELLKAIENHQMHLKQVQQAIAFIDQPAQPYKNYGKTKLRACYENSNDVQFIFVAEFMAIDPKTFLELYLHKVENKIEALEKEFAAL